MAERGLKVDHATLIGIEFHHMLRKNQHNDAANLAVFEQFYALAA